MYEDGEAQWISDLRGVRNKLLRFLSILLRGEGAYDTDHTKIYNPGTKTDEHTQDADLALSGWRVKRNVAPQGGCQRMFRGRPAFAET